LKLEAVREGSMKLHLAAPTSDGKSGKGPAAKASLQLYDLSKDIGESRDLAASQPDTVHRLMELARKMEGDLGMDGIGPGCRPLGKVQDPRPLIDSDGNIRSEFR
jgi:hypothetical protein